MQHSCACGSAGLSSRRRETAPKPPTHLFVKYHAHTDRRYRTLQRHGPVLVTNCIGDVNRQNLSLGRAVQAKLETWPRRCARRTMFRLDVMTRRNNIIDGVIGNTIHFWRYSHKKLFSVKKPLCKVLIRKLGILTFLCVSRYGINCVKLLARQCNAHMYTHTSNLVFGVRKNFSDTQYVTRERRKQ